LGDIQERLQIMRTMPDLTVPPAQLHVRTSIIYLDSDNLFGLISIQYLSLFGLNFYYAVSRKILHHDDAIRIQFPRIPPPGIHREPPIPPQEFIENVLSSKPKLKSSSSEPGIRHTGSLTNIFPLRNFKIEELKH
jgi:hypothetical protein